MEDYPTDSDGLPSFEPLEAFFEDESVSIMCPDRNTVQKLTDKLNHRHPEETFDIQQVPVTNDEDGTVEGIKLGIKRLHYDDELGWFSADLRDIDIDLR